MDISRIIGSRQTESTKQEDSSQKAEQTPVSQAGISAIQDQVVSAVDNKLQDALHQSEFDGEHRLTNEQQELADKSIEEFTDRLNNSNSNQGSADSRQRVTNLNPFTGASQSVNDHGISEQKAKFQDYLHQIYPNGTPMEQIDIMLDGDFSQLSQQKVRSKILDNLGVADPRGQSSDPNAPPAGYKGGSFGIGNVADGEVLVGKETGTETKNADGSRTTNYHLTFIENNNAVVERAGTVNTTTDGTQIKVEWETKKSADGSTTESIEVVVWDNNDNIYTSKESTTTSANGTVTTDTKTTTESGKSAKLTGSWEDYRGNIPEPVKQLTQHFIDELRAAGPHKGGETVHTDDSASGGAITGGKVDNVVTRQGEIGLLGNPGSVNSAGGTITPAGGGLAGPNDGFIDYGPDSDQTGWSGTTHQDDPGDVNFGRSAPVDPDAISSDQNKEDENKTTSLFDFLNRTRKKSEEDS